MADDMTYSLYEAAQPLLEPLGFNNPTDIAAMPSIVPAEPGIYGWWFDGALPDVPREGALQRDGRHLLYVGIAPNGASEESTRNLRKRLADHCRGVIARSTVRRTLACLLERELHLRITRTSLDKVVMSASDEQSLNDWMSVHMRVAWMVHPAPWTLEDEMIRSGPKLPLNIMGSSHPFSAVLKAKRTALGRS